MKNRAPLAVTSLLLASLAACSSSTTTPTDPAPTGNTPPTTGEGTTPEGTTPAGPGAPFKTYVILGDSISDRGGSGPFFYDLVGTDLKEKLGNVAIVKKSKGGAVSAQLATQVKALPATLEGPVAVSVTIGGNDMQGAAIDILQGNDTKQRTAFAANIKKAYDELTTAGRFGEGVKVTIFHATIYDPSDGTGDFAGAGCPGYLSALPKQSTTGFWDNWNKAAAEVLTNYGDAIVTVDIRTQFQGHGVEHLKDGSSWYDADCIHPNTTGHAELRKMFVKAIAP